MLLSDRCLIDNTKRASEENEERMMERRKNKQEKKNFPEWPVETESSTIKILFNAKILFPLIKSKRFSIENEDDVVDDDEMMVHAYTDTSIAP
jgi:hypothetical protein